MFFNYCSISVELRRWSGYGALFTRLDKYRALTVNLFRHSTLYEQGLYLSIVNKILRHRHSWLARQYGPLISKLCKTHS